MDQQRNFYALIFMLVLSFSGELKSDECKTSHGLDQEFAEFAQKFGAHTEILTYGHYDSENDTSLTEYGRKCTYRIVQNSPYIVISLVSDEQHVSNPPGGAPSIMGSMCMVDKHEEAVFKYDASADRFLLDNIRDSGRGIGRAARRLLPSKWRGSLRRFYHEHMNDEGDVRISSDCEGEGSCLPASLEIKNANSFDMSIYGLFKGSFNFNGER